MLRYFDINWMSLKDGPGRRVVVFLQGCNLSCKWCHSPHSQPFVPPLLYNSEYCAGCGNCIKLCPCKALNKNFGKVQIDREKCISCGMCTKQCKTDALKILYREMEEETLYKLLLPELKLLSGYGGITVSGGEPLLQAEGLEKFFGLLVEEGVNIAVETSGAVGLESIKKIERYVNVWLYGLKQTDIKLCMEQTGADHYSIIKNLKYIQNSVNAKIIIRTPIIPGMTDSLNNIRGIRDVMQEFGLISVEFLKYNPYTPYYYRLIGLAPPQLEFDLGCIPKIERLFDGSGIEAKFL